MKQLKDLTDKEIENLISLHYPIGCKFTILGQSIDHPSTQDLPERGITPLGFFVDRNIEKEVFVISNANGVFFEEGRWSHVKTGNGRWKQPTLTHTHGNSVTLQNLEPKKSNDRVKEVHARIAKTEHRLDMIEKRLNDDKRSMVGVDYTFKKGETVWFTFKENPTDNDWIRAEILDLNWAYMSAAIQLEGYKGVTSTGIKSLHRK